MRTCANADGAKPVLLLLHGFPEVGPLGKGFWGGAGGPPGGSCCHSCCRMLGIEGWAGGVAGGVGGGVVAGGPIAPTPLSCLHHMAARLKLRCNREGTLRRCACCTPPHSALPRASHARTARGQLHASSTCSSLWQGWFSWRHQMEALRGGFSVVALDMRGYGGSDKPQVGGVGRGRGSAGQGG